MSSESPEFPSQSLQFTCEGDQDNNKADKTSKRKVWFPIQCHVYLAQSCAQLQRARLAGKLLTNSHKFSVQNFYLAGASFTSDSPCDLPEKNVSSSGFNFGKANARQNVRFSKKCELHIIRSKSWLANLWLFEHLHRKYDAEKEVGAALMVDKIRKDHNPTPHQATTKCTNSLSLEERVIYQYRRDGTEDSRISLNL